MYGSIILRNLPQNEIQIDLGRVEVKGWYRGFDKVPAGLHYVGVMDEGEVRGFWCWVKAGEAIVRVYDHERKIFIEDTPEATTTFNHMATSGLMTRTLIPYNMRLYTEWTRLTHHITPEALPPVLIFGEDDVAGTGSRFDNAYYGTHNGSDRAFLTELQFSFLCWQMDWSCCDTGAKDRWTHLLTAVSRAGVERMLNNPNLFVSAVDVLMAQFDALYDGAYNGGPLLAALSDGIIDDMRATNSSRLIEKADDFAAFIYAAQRAVS